MNAKLINVFIDEKPSKVPLGYTVMQSCVQAGIDIPRFCYHDKLLIAGNCRICLVELTGSKKLLASCAVHISDNAYVYTNTARVKLARQNVLEFLLANHPLDCPICDQGGECDLQDITAVFGADRGRFYEATKRAVLNKDFGPLIRTSMNRCIHCTRCVRFLSVASGMSVLGTLGRGSATEIGTYIDRFLHDELSGNVTDLCPVGALTSKPYSFKARPWELISTEGLDIFDALNSTLSVDVAANKICRVLPYANEIINSGWLTNRARYAYDGIFFQRLNSCLLKIQFLQTIQQDFLALKPSFLSFFIKLSWTAAISVFFKKLFTRDLSFFYLEIGLSLDLESTINSFEFASLLGGRAVSASLSSVLALQDFTNIFLFNTSLSDLSRLPSFVFFLGTNPRLESPLINLKLTTLQSDFSVPFYRIGSSIAYYTYPVRLISNSINSFFAICEFKHLFCKNFYSKTFLVSPFFLLGAQLLNSPMGAVITAALIALIKRLRNLTLFSRSYLTFNLSEFSFFSVLGMYSGWVHCLDIGVESTSTNFFTSQIGRFSISTSRSFKNTNFLYYCVNSDSNYLLQALPAFVNFWTVYQGSHGGVIAGFSNLILPTTTYVERTVFYKNLLGLTQKSLPAVLYSRVPRTDKEIFSEMLTYAGRFLFKNFFCFNFKQAIAYNYALSVGEYLYLTLEVKSLISEFIEALNRGAFKLNLTLEKLHTSYQYSFLYWSYFSYTWKLANKRGLVVNHFSNFMKHFLQTRLYALPISSSLINYYSDASLPILTASKAMSMCSSLYLKKNLSVMQLHL